MSGSDGNNPERMLASLLVAYDEALRADTPRPEFEDSIVEEDVPLVGRYRAAKECLELLDRVRRLDGWRCETRPTAPDQRLDKPLEAQTWPATVGRFQIEGELGRGGMGVILLARDPELNRRVAIKIPRVEIFGRGELARRFVREAEAAARLSHPHLVTLYEVGREGSQCYLVSEYCAGPTLSQWLAAHPGSLDPRRATRLVQKLAEAVHHAHGRGVLHRDIKPSNVLLTAPADPRAVPLARESQEQVDIDALCPKLTDFGLAKLLESGGDETRSGAIIGTPAFMAPEQADGRIHEVDARTDVYALGALLYQLLTGAPPYRGATDVDTLRQLLLHEPVAPRKLHPEVARDLEAICLKCLAKDPAARYPTAQHLAEDLNRYIAGQPTQARPLRPLARAWKWCKRRPALAALWSVVAASAFMLLVVVAGYNARLSDEVVRADAARDVAQRESAASRRLLYTADIRVAYETLKSNNFVQALAILDRYVPKPGETDLREFAWDALREQCLPTTLNLVGHEGDVFDVAFSPDGRRLATAGKDCTARLWDSATGELVHTLRGHEDEVTSVAFNPSGKYLATASEDGTIRIWTVSRGQLRQTYSAHTDHVLAVAWSPDGRRLASGGRDCTVRLWDVETDNVIATFADVEVVRALTFSPADDRLFAVDELGALHVWNLMEDRLEPRHMLEREKLFALAVSHDAALVAAGGRREEILVWNTAQVGIEPPQKLLGHTDWVQSLAFAPGDHRLASAGRDGVIHLWNPGQSLPERTLLGHRDRLWSVAWSPDGLLLASAAADGARVWTPNGNVEPAYETSRYTHAEVDFFPDGTRFATASQSDGIVRIWDCSRHARAGWFEAHPPGAYCRVRISPDGKLIASRGHDQTKIWHSDSFELVRTLETSAAHLPLAWEPGSRRLAITEQDNVVSIVNVDTGQVERRLAHSSPVWKVAFTHDGRHLAMTSQTLEIWDVLQSRVVCSIPGQYGDVTASRDRNLIAATSGSNVILVDLATHPPNVSTLVTRGNKVTRLALDGPTLAVVVDPPAGVSLWDVDTRQFLMELPCKAVNTSGVAFSPDGRRLVVVGENDKSGAIWEWTARER